MKLFKKLAVAVVGAVMALGVGIGVNAGAKGVPAKAAGVEYSFTIDKNDFTTASYAANDGEHTSTAVATGDSTKTMSITWTCKNVFQSGGGMQWKSGSGYIYNKTDLTSISSISISSGSNLSYVINTTQNPSSNSSDKKGGYFKISCSGGTGKSSSVTVTFSVQEGAATTLNSIIGIEGSLEAFTGGAWDLTSLTPIGTLSDDTSTNVDISDYVTLSTSDPVPGTAGNTTVSVTVTPKSGSIEAATFDVSAIVTDPAKYELVNNVEDLVAGANYIIGSSDSVSGVFMKTETNANNRKQTSSFNITNNMVVFDESMLVLELGGSSGAWTFATKNYEGANGYLASAVSGNNNYCRVISDITTATISFSENAAVINIEPHVERTILRYNSSSSCFACYSTGQSSVYLFKEVANTPAITMDSARTVDAGDTFDLTATASCFTPTNFTWSIENASPAGCATVSGNSLTGSVTAVAAGSATVKLVASDGSNNATATCDLTIKAVPASVQVKVGGEVVNPEYVMEAFEGKYKTPTVEILPSNASQTYTLSVLNESESGSFTINNKNINFVKKNQTGIIRVSSSKEGVYFDLNVKCNADNYISNTLSYSGTPVEQVDGSAFNDEGLTFAISKDSATGVAVDNKDMTYSPATLTEETTEVIATHTPSGQTVTIPVSVRGIAGTYHITSKINSGSGYIGDASIEQINANTNNNAPFTFTKTGQIRFGASAGKDSGDVGGVNDIIFANNSTSLTLSVNEAFVISRVEVSASAKTTSKISVTVGETIVSNIANDSRSNIKDYAFSSSITISVSGWAYVEYIDVTLTKKNSVESMANAYAVAFNELTGGECSALKGISAATWTKCSNAYTAAVAQNSDLADALKEGTPAQAGDSLGQALYRYDMILAKYSKVDFMNRGTGASASRVTVVDSSATMMAAIISFIGVSTIAGYFFLRKKKQTF